MAEEGKDNGELKRVSRREFFKSAGAAMAGAAMATGLSAPLNLASAGPLGPLGEPLTLTRVQLKYTCPIEGKTFSSFEELKQHFAQAHPQAAVPAVTTLKVNGQEYQVQIEPHWTLQRTLQFKLGLTGAKTMCDRGECGSCTVIMDGKAVLSCSVLAVECEGKEIETIEGVAADPKWSPLIQSYMKYDTMQCGYCTTGFIMTAKALLMKNPNPSEEDIRQALGGNICRCSTYPRHPKAILEAAQVLRGGN